MRSIRALQLGALALSGAFMVVFPLLPRLQERAGISTAQLGWIATAGFIAALVAQLLIAPHADRGRERLVLGSAVVVMSLSTLSFAVGDSLWWFVAGRIGAGLAYGAYIPVAVGLIIRHVPDRHGEHIGRLQAIDLAGMAAGPVLAVIGEASIGVAPTLVVAAIASLLIGLPVITTSITPVISTPATHPRPSDGVRLLRHRSVVAAALLMTAFYIPIGAYDALYPRFLADLGAPDWMLGVALTVFAVPSILLAPWAGRQVDRIGPFRAATRGGAANVTIIVLYGFVTMPIVVVAIGLLESGGQLLVGAAGAAAMGRAVPGGRASTAQGLGQAIATGAAAVVAALAAPLYAAGGPLALFGTTAVVTAAVLAAGVRAARGSLPVEARIDDAAALVPASPLPLT